MASVLGEQQCQKENPHFLPYIHSQFVTQNGLVLWLLKNIKSNGVGSMFGPAKRDEKNASSLR